MGKAGKIKVEVPSMNLRSIVLVVPKNVEEKRQLVARGLDLDGV